MVAVRHNGSVGHVLGHHLVVSIIVRNLAEIDAVDLIINMKLSIFCPFGWNMSIQAQSCFLGGISSPKWGAISTKPQKEHPYTSLRCLSH